MICKSPAFKYGSASTNSLPANVRFAQQTLQNESFRGICSLNSTHYEPSAIVVEEIHYGEVGHFGNDQG
jgi:hypothetical protein